MTLNSNTQFEEKLTLGSKSDMRNLVNFNASMGNYVMFSSKTIEGLCREK